MDFHWLRTTYQYLHAVLAGLCGVASDKYEKRFHSNHKGWTLELFGPHTGNCPCNDPYVLDIHFPSPNIMITCDSLKLMILIIVPCMLWFWDLLQEVPSRLRGLLLAHIIIYDGRLGPYGFGYVH